MALHLSTCTASLTRPPQKTRTDTHIIVSTLQDTHLLRISDSGGTTTLTRIEDSPAGGLITTFPTLAISNVARRVIGANGQASYVNSSLVVQVTPKSALLLEHNEGLGTYTQLAGWEVHSGSTAGRPLEIVAASINPSQVLVALSGGRLVALSITEKDQFREVV